MATQGPLGPTWEPCGSQHGAYVGTTNNRTAFMWPHGTRTLLKQTQLDFLSGILMFMQLQCSHMYARTPGQLHNLILWFLRGILTTTHRQVLLVCDTFGEGGLKLESSRKEGGTRGKSQELNDTDPTRSHHHL